MGEKEISNNSFNSLKYAIDVIKDRFIEGEKAIMDNLETAMDYVKNIIKGRWFEAEKEYKNLLNCDWYQKIILNSKPKFFKY